MQFADSNKIVLGMFAALAIGSLGLKAAAGPPQDGFADPRPLQTEQQLSAALRAQGFSTRLALRRYQSSVVFAERGSCRLSVRRARGDDAENVVYAREAASIGPVRYLYEGRRYASAPTLKIRLKRLETEMLGRVGLAPTIHVPIALATSRACGSGDFDLEDVQIAS